MQFIVAEVSKSYIDGHPVNGATKLCELFEMVIETNRERGYRLHSFNLHQIMMERGKLVETIIAVFEQHEWTTS